MSAPFDGHAICARDDYERVSKYFASRTACEEAFEETVKKRRTSHRGRIGVRVIISFGRARVSLSLNCRTGNRHAKFTTVVVSTVAERSEDQTPP